MKIFKLICVLLLLSKQTLAQNNCATLDNIANLYLNNATAVTDLHKKIKIKFLQNAIVNQKWKVASSIDANLPYSNAIEAVIQPDGTSQYIPRNFINPIFTLNTSKKIVKTGGDVGLSGSLGLFQNLNNSSKQFSANWFNVYITQPLFAFNEYKVEKQIQQINLSIDSIQYLKDKQAKLKEFMSEVFNYEIIKNKIDQLKESEKQNITLIKRFSILIENGKALETDTLILYNTHLQNEINKEKLLLDKKIKQSTLSYYLKNNYEYTICNIQDFPNIILDTSILIKYYIAHNFAKELITDSLNTIYAIERAKKANGIRTGISAGIGVNQSASLFNQLFIAPTQRQNINITTSVPLTGWVNYSKNKEIANIESAIYNNTKSEIYFKAIIWAQEKVSAYYLLIKQNNMLQNKKFSLEQLQSSQIEKINAGKSNTIDYNNINTQLQLTNAEILEVLKNIYMFRYDILSSTLYDIVANKLVY